MKLKGDWGPDIWMRDPAVIYWDGLYHCFYTHIDRKRAERSGWRLALARITSPDAREWSKPEILLDSPLGYSSPGNVIRTEEGFVICLQSYPIDPGEVYGNQNCRLWLMKSRDLKSFEPPVVIREEGCTAAWAVTKRQIDPYLLCDGSTYYVFYKTDGCLGLMKSENLVEFEEASAGPVLMPSQLPDHSTVENPCVIRDGDGYRMFFAPCRKGRGIGVARSQDQIHWHDIRYLDFPQIPWAPGGPTAPMVLDDRSRSGKWLMFFHGDTEGEHGGALGMAYSEDLENWGI